MRTIRDAEFQVIELRAILGKTEYVPVVPDLVVPNVDVPELQSIVDDRVVPMVNLEDEDIEDNEEPEMDSEELEQIGEDDIEEHEIVEDVVVITLGDDIEKDQIAGDIIEVVPRAIAKIAQIVVVWAAEMVAQPDGFIIGKKELVEAIAKAAVLAAAVEGDIEDDVDDDVEDDDFIILADLDDELEVIPYEMTFGPDDVIPPYEFDVENFQARRHRI